MKNKIKTFFEFNKEKIIIALLFSLFLSIVGNYFFRFNFTGEIATNAIFLNMVYPVGFLYKIIFAPFLNMGDISNSGAVYKLLLSIFSSVFMLFFQYFYYYLVACFIFLIKNKMFKNKQV